MPESTLPRPVCGHCDGFPTVAVTTGTRSLDGHRHTVNADCPACHGTGHTLPAARTTTPIGA
ncbi:hypothetical protein [Streptomyces sp. NPDC057682]|uniref:hypothetical protein n=1 Tax=Streptomyces sp. NPDC057682 TaxID=3346210 RepID=UPI003681C6E5